jgi:hypothetical protein
MTDENRKIIDNIMKGVTIDDLDALLAKKKIEKDEYCWWVEELVCALSKSKLDVYSEYEDPEFIHGWESPANDKECAIYAGISYAIQDLYRLRDGIPSAFRIYHNWFDMGVISRLGENPDSTPRAYTPVDAYNTYLCSICNILSQKLLQDEPTLYLLMCEMEVKIDDVINEVMDMPNEFVYSFRYEEILIYLRHFMMVIKKEVWGEWAGKAPENVRAEFFSKLTSDDKGYLDRLERTFDEVHQKIADDIGVPFYDIPSKFVVEIIGDLRFSYYQMFHQVESCGYHADDENRFRSELMINHPDLYEVVVSKNIIKEHVEIRMMFNEIIKGECCFEFDSTLSSIIDYLYINFIDGNSDVSVSEEETDVEEPYLTIEVLLQGLKDREVNN